MSDTTLTFYHLHAADYAVRDEGADPRLPVFLRRCREGGKILELGTGGGGDAAAILSAGFDLDATDGSPELAAIATKRLGRPVRTMLFDELDADKLYDGVYACASLTHAPRAALGSIVAKIHRALKPGGLVWASFKTGTQEGTDSFGRYYNYLSENALVSLWRDNAPWKTLEAESWMGGGYDRKPTAWCAITAER